MKHRDQHPKNHNHPNNKPDLGPPGPHHHHGHRHDYGIGKKIVAQDNLPDLLNIFESEEDYSWAVRLATMESPPHRQVRNSIILNLIAQIVNRVNAKGDNLETRIIRGTSPREYGFQYPVGFPEEVLREFIQDETAVDWIGDGPLEEVAMDLTVIKSLVAIKIALDNTVNISSESDDGKNQ